MRLNRQRSQQKMASSKTVYNEKKVLDLPKEIKKRNDEMRQPFPAVNNDNKEVKICRK